MRYRIFNHVECRAETIPRVTRVTRLQKFLEAKTLPRSLVKFLWRALYARRRDLIVSHGPFIHTDLLNLVGAMAENRSINKRQKLSKVWDHYTLNKEENKVQCLYCKIELAYHNSTSSMIQHLNRRHPLYAVSPSIAETR